MSESVNKAVEEFRKMRAKHEAVFGEDGFVKSSSEIGGSSEEIIARPIVSWFEEYASAYNFEPNGQFFRELDDDKFKNLDLDKLWELVGPHLKDLIKEYLEYYEGDGGEQVWRAKGE